MWLSRDEREGAEQGSTPLRCDVTAVTGRGGAGINPAAHRVRPGLRQKRDEEDKQAHLLKVRVQIYPETAQSCRWGELAGTNLPRNSAVLLLCWVCWYQSTPKLRRRGQAGSPPQGARTKHNSIQKLGGTT
eukprot:3671406-Rhodomonas_salina.1